MVRCFVKGKHKDRLTKMNIIQQDATRCVLCNLYKETSAHLFLHYAITWNIWCDYLRIFGITWLTPQNLCNLLDFWFGIEIEKHRRKFWYLVPNSICGYLVYMEGEEWHYFLAKEFQQRSSIRLDSKLLSIMASGE